MIFEITHTTRYTYSQPVFLEPHDLRLRPRCDVAQELTAFDLRVTPAPASMSDGIDPEGNPMTHVWFAGVTRAFAVTSRATVRTLRANPFDFVAPPWALHLPMMYGDEAAPPLALYRDRNEGDEAVSRFAAGIAVEVGGHTIDFLVALSRRIHDTCRRVVRPEGEPYAAATTLQAREGACRDLTVLFIDACRAVGLAARFVSGYHYEHGSRRQRHLHAWAEVYLPAGGWRGFDPSQGLAVADAHVALAASATPRGAAPTTGTFRGLAAESTMEVDLDIRVSGDGDGGRDA